MKIGIIIGGFALMSCILNADYEIKNNRSLGLCNSDFAIDSKLIDEKGVFLSSKDIVNTHFGDGFHVFNGKNKIDSYTLVADGGFIYQNILYKFPNTWKESTLTALNEDYRFKILCGNVTKNKSTPNLLKMQDLSLEFQNIFENWIVENSKNLLLNNATGGFIVSNDLNYVPSEILNIDEYVTIIKKIKVENEKLIIGFNSGNSKITYPKLIDNFRTLSLMELQNENK